MEDPQSCVKALYIAKGTCQNYCQTLAALGESWLVISPPLAARIQQLFHGSLGKSHEEGSSTILMACQLKELV